MRLKCLNLEVLLQELVPSDHQKLFNILEVYSRRLTGAEARVVFEVVNIDEYPEDFFFTRPSTATVIAFANNADIEIKWKGEEGKVVYIKDCYHPESFPTYADE